MKKKNGQVWVETVMYTLIGLALIGIVLAIVIPRVNQSKDKILVEQSIDDMEKLDEKIMEVWDWGPGNIRNVDFKVRQGELYINGSGDEIILVIRDLDKPYSEPGEIIKNGRINIRSEQGQKKNRVYLSLDYSGVANITYNREDVLKQFDSASSAYNFFIENKDDVPAGSLFEIDISESSV